MEHYRALGALRREHPALKDGEFRFLAAQGGFIAYERVRGKDSLTILANMGETQVYTLTGNYTDALTGERVPKELTLPTCSWRILARSK